MGACMTGWGGGMLCVAGDMHGRFVSQFRRLKE